MMKLRSKETGFTIVELMIATLVFSSIILVITFGVMQFSKAYYRGVTNSKTQNTARQVVEAVSQALQFSGGTLLTSSQAGVQTFCVGDSQFDYRLNQKRATNGHVLYVSPNPSSVCQTKTTFDASSRELLEPNMRLVKFDVSKVQGSETLFKVNVRVVYGDTDLLAPDGQSCKADIGSEFCAASELTTTIQKRIN